MDNGKALDGGKIAIATRNAARAEMLSLLRQLASYVTGNCNADLVLLLSSGFEPVKAPSPVGVLPAPENLRLTLTGISGELHLRFDRVPNAANYTVQSAENPDGPWENQALSTATRVTIKDRTPGKVYWVRAQANGSAGPSGWGRPANAMAVWAAAERKVPPENPKVPPEHTESGSPQGIFCDRGRAKAPPRFAFESCLCLRFRFPKIAAAFNQAALG